MVRSYMSGMAQVVCVNSVCAELKTGIDCYLG